MSMALPSESWTRAGLVRNALLVILCAVALRGGPALAADSSELWPDLEAFVRLNPGARIYTNVAYAEGRESATQSLDLTAALDVSIKPILRTSLRTEDWQRSRFLWTRVGYTHVDKVDDGVRKTPEDRLFVQLLAKAELPAQVWLEARARTDFRWIGDDYSNRYRFRLEATREFKVRGHDVVPFLKAEWFYDTRYDGWSRALYQAGPEITFNKRFRLEPYLSRQIDRLPDDETVDALGITAKLYFR
jgi:hypothetical protein